MPAETHINVGGTWRKISANGVYVRVGGSWQQADYIYRHEGGSWRTVYIRDSTGPAAPTGGNATWRTVNGLPSGTPSLYIAWGFPSDPDYAYTQVLLRPIGQPFLPAFNVSYPISEVHYTAYVPNNVVFEVTLTPYDVNGNAGTPTMFQSNAWTGVTRGRSPNPLTIDAVDSGTFRAGAWRTDGGVQPNNRRVYQGASVSGVNYGVFMYGNQILDKLAGATISAANFGYYRVNQGGQGGAVAPQLWFSPHITSKAVSPEAVGIFEGPKAATGVAINGSASPFATVPIHSDWFDNLATGNSLGTVRAIVMYSLDQTLQGYLGNVSESYAQFYGVGEAPGTVVPGRLVVTHTG